MVATRSLLLSANDLHGDAFLDHIAHRALVLTGATGGAIALRQQQLIVCQARCGESIPPLGAKLDANSGISGECMRTGLALICGDTENDPRVERDVCSRLGIRSIAVVPIGTGTETTGVLEVVSARPHAFEDAQLQILTELASLVADAVSGTADSGIASLQRVVIPAPPGLHTADAGGVGPIESSSLGRSRRQRSSLNNKRNRAIAAAVFLIAGLVIATGLLRREGRPKPTSASPAEALGLPGPSLPAQPSGEDTQARGTSQPGLADVVVVPPSPAGKTAATNHESDLSERKLSGSLRQGQISRPEAPIIVRDEVPRNQQSSGDIPADPPPTPALAPAAAGSDDGAGEIGKILSSQVPSPPALPVFQAISGGTLDRNVNPVYPREALALKLEGSVVLSVVIDESGNVRVLKTLSGDPILARAAIDAVRQWHYHPFLLNGQPIKREAKITLAFKLP